MIEHAVRNPKRIVLAEGEDQRVASAAVRAAGDGIATPILIGAHDVVSKQIRLAGGVAEMFLIVDPANSNLLQSFADAYAARQNRSGRKSISENEALSAVRNPVVFAAMMVQQGLADGAIGGAQATTTETVRAALQFIGPATKSTLVSSFMLMGIDPRNNTSADLVCFADCGLVVEPSVDELAKIAIASADSYQTLTGTLPAVAVLSFSTKGSAQHELVKRSSETVSVVRSLRPDLVVDGELQFDAAFVPEVCASKAPSSPLAGKANVFIFPNLEAGNIGYKIAERLGGAVAIGPILQGLAQPANDLSRGCSSDDVYHLLAVTSVQAAARSA